MAQRRRAARRGLAATALVLAGLLAVPSGSGAVTSAEQVRATAPQLTDPVVSADTDSVTYDAFTTAASKFKHTRAQFFMHFTCVSPGDSSGTQENVGGTADSETPIDAFASPVVKRTFPLGALCEGWSDWLLGGGGGPGGNCPYPSQAYCDGKGTSSRETFATPPGPVENVRSRLSKKDKKAAKKTLDALLTEKNTLTNACSLGAGTATCKLASMAGRTAEDYSDLVNDPPDARYKAKVTIRRPKATRFTVAEAGAGAVAPLNRYGASLSAVSGTTTALVRAIEKAQGAEQAKSRKWRKAQMLAAGRFAKALARATRRLRIDSAAAGKALERTRPGTGGTALANAGLLRSYAAMANGLDRWARAVKKSPLKTPR